MILDRYVLPAVVGFSILAPVMVFRAAQGKTAVGIAILLIGLASAGYQVRGQWRDIAQRHRTIGALRPTLEAAPDLPIVVTNSHRALELAHYERIDIVSRLRYLIGPTPGDSETVETVTSNPFPPNSPIRVEALTSFLRHDRRFLIFDAGDDDEAILSTLLTRGARVRLLATSGDGSFFLVE